MGATLVAEGATFRVWAQNAHEVHVLGDFTEWNPAPGTRLQRIDGDHWWGFVGGACDRQAYKFWVVGYAGSGWKRDPYARELDWDSGDCILRQPDFPWHDTGFVTPRFENFVIYQVHVGVYSTPRWPPGAAPFSTSRLGYPILPTSASPPCSSCRSRSFLHLQPRLQRVGLLLAGIELRGAGRRTACLCRIDRCNARVEGLVAVCRSGPEGRDEPAEGAGGSGARARDRRDLRRGLQPCRRRLRRSELVLLRPAARAATTRAVREFLYFGLHAHAAGACSISPSRKCGIS